MSTSGGIQFTAPTTLFQGTPVSAESGNQANAAAVATLPGVIGKTTTLDGFSVALLGATAGGTVDLTITGPVNTIHVSVSVPTGATVAQAPMIVELPVPIPAAAANTAIVVTLPALGAGNTNARVSAHGRQV